MLSELVRLAERERAGLIEPTDKHRKRPIAEHLEDYEHHLVAKANAPRYVSLAIGRIKALVAGCRIRTILDLSPSGVSNWLRNQRDLNAFGVSTSNDYLVAIKAFGNWLVRDGRLADNPLAHLQRLNAELDVRRQRRVLTPDELSRLIAAAEANRCTEGPNQGSDRAMLYRLAAFTGLRAQELASLTARSFSLRSNPPTVCVEACYSKHRRTDVLPLEASLAENLEDFLRRRIHEPACGGPTKRLWPGKWYRKAARMLRHDLKAARMAWIDEAKNPEERADREQSGFLLPSDSSGREADFHSLRHGFITYLVTANVPPKVAQMLARHSTITLTMDRYTHLGINDLAGALQRLPALPATTTLDSKVS
jgi:integrase